MILTNPITSSDPGLPRHHSAFCILSNSQQGATLVSQLLVWGLLRNSMVFILYSMLPLIKQGMPKGVATLSPTLLPTAWFHQEHASQCPCLSDVVLFRHRRGFILSRSRASCLPEIADLLGFCLFWHFPLFLFVLRRWESRLCSLFV